MLQLLNIQILVRLRPLVPVHAAHSIYKKKIHDTGQHFNPFTSKEWSVHFSSRNSSTCVAHHLHVYHRSYRMDLCELLFHSCIALAIGTSSSQVFLQVIWEIKLMSLSWHLLMLLCPVFYIYKITEVSGN